MGMDAEVLAPALKQKLQDNLLAEPDRGFKMVDADGKETNLEYMCQAIADAVAAEVIKHIQTCAEATSQVTTEVASGIPVATTGSATAQTGTTTGSGAGTGTGTIPAGSIR